jgi:hypothetical protein
MKVSGPGFIAATFGALKTVPKWNTFCFVSKRMLSVLIAGGPNSLIYHAKIGGRIGTEVDCPNRCWMQRLGVAPVSKKSLIAVLATVLAALAGQGAWAAGDDSPASAATGHSAGTSADAAEQLQEVTVTAHRAELAPRVANFVNHIAALENEEGLPRWQKPVCPSVSGLSRQDGEFMLARISEIARQAGVPLAGERCRANLYVLVHPRPKELLLAMEKRNWVYTFGRETHPIEIDEFIATPRPVKVWYNSIEKKSWDAGNGSLLRNYGVWALTHVFVVVDYTRLQAVSRGQLADYVALVGLAQLKPGAHLGDAPTIMKLFDGPPQAGPAGMTVWDQALLKSLYATEQESKLQRSQIVHQMVHEIAP